MVDERLFAGTHEFPWNGRNEHGHRWCSDGANGGDDQMITQMMRWGAIGGLLLSGIAAEGRCGNEKTTIILHAQEALFECTSGPQPFDCSSTSQPTVIVPPGELAFVYVFLRGAEDVIGLTCRFAVDGGSGPDTWGDWNLLGAVFGCLPGQLEPELPATNADGREPGNLRTVFNCVTSPALQPLGYLVFQVGTQGCLSIEEHELGTGVLDCNIEMDPVPAGNRGRICVGPGGYDACDPAATAVGGTTWARIKHQYVR